MKKIFLFTITTAILFILLAFRQPGDEPIQDCSSSNQTYLIQNFHAYGNQQLNFQQVYHLADMASRGYTITLSFKADKYCKFTSSKTVVQTSPDFWGSSIANVSVPITSDFKRTLKVESGCVYDYYLGMDVKYIWTKTNTSDSENWDLGFPQPAYCATVKSSSDRELLIEVYEDNGRLASASTR